MFGLMFKSTHERIVKNLTDEIKYCNDDLAFLRAELEKAQANDRRDPKTKKFVNAKTGLNKPKKKK